MSIEHAKLYVRHLVICSCRNVLYLSTYKYTKCQKLTSFYTDFVLISKNYGFNLKESAETIL